MCLFQGDNGMLTLPMVFLSLFVVAARIMQYWRIDGDAGDANDILNRSLSRSNSPWPRTQEWIENMLLFKVRKTAQYL